MTNFFRLTAALLAGACALGAQTFIQMSDPQFGMYSKNQNFTHETANFEFAIATANRLKPAFVVVTGDLINEGSNAAQATEFHRIAGKLSKSIRLFSVPGNHDVENEPTKESLARYRKGFGPDYYTFTVGGIMGIVLNSNLEKDVHNVPDEASKMEAWFRGELAKAKGAGGRVIVFQHIPFFLSDANEEDQYFNIPRETRARYLKMLHEAGVEYVFAGHYHRNSEGHDGALDMVTTGPVGMPIEGGKSGMRIVTVTPAGVKHLYYDLADLPDTLEPPPPAK